jgi:hypothetical protein
MIAIRSAAASATTTAPAMEPMIHQVVVLTASVSAIPAVSMRYAPSVLA